MIGTPSVRDSKKAAERSVNSNRLFFTVYKLLQFRQELLC